MPRDVAPVQVRVDSDTKARWEESAKKAGLSLADYVRAAVEHAEKSLPATPVGERRFPAFVAGVLRDLDRPARPDPRPHSEKPGRR